ncbi:hypothetical protein [Streptomyces hebeiensis]
MSRTAVDMLLEQGHPEPAFVRQDDARAGALRQAGAEVFVDISGYEQSFMTFEKMTLPEEERRARWAANRCSARGTRIR